MTAFETAGPADFVVLVLRLVVNGGFSHVGGSCEQLFYTNKNNKSKTTIHAIFWSRFRRNLSCLCFILTVVVRSSRVTWFCDVSRRGYFKR